MNSARRRSRTPLSTSLTQNLNVYALSAGAAGVAVLALASAAEAKIVYTPTHLELEHGSYPIDINNDGQADFHLYHWTNGSSAGEASGLAIGNSYAPATNGIVATRPFRAGFYAAAFPAGGRIGPRRAFRADASLCVVSYSFHYRKVNWFGQWANLGRGLTNRYLGVKFNIDQQVHYGWLRISVSTTHDHFTAELTGYAYETIPNKPIVAGQTEDSNEGAVSESFMAPTPPPAMLGLLALGSLGLSIWRDEESAMQ